ncbi:MAG: hypothetical protein R3254_06745 [Thiomicrorhabdus sp.]|nr:hypothetical protein [Thiomicrorhabdus sp.]
MDHLNWFLRKLSSFLILAIVLFVVYQVALNLFQAGLSVTFLNTVAIISTLVIITPLAIFSSTAHNLDGKMSLTSFLAWLGTFITFVGVISSILVAYSDIQNSEQIAQQVAMISPVYNVVFFGWFLLMVKREERGQ